MLDESGGGGGGGLVTEDGGRTLKRVQIKLEHGLGLAEELPGTAPSVGLPPHHSPDAFLTGSTGGKRAHQPPCDRFAK